VEVLKVTEIRALTLRQPWAWAVIWGGKNVENRTRGIGAAWIHDSRIEEWYWDGRHNPSTPAWVAIHAAQRRDNLAFASLSYSGNLLSDAEQKVRMDSPHQYAKCIEMLLATGAILGVVELVGVHYPNGGVCRPHGTAVMAGCPPCEGLCSEWAMPGMFHLELANPRPLPEPVPWRGQQGLWRLDTAQVPGLEALL
jgi:hypothetical protein